MNNNYSRQFCKQAISKLLQDHSSWKMFFIGQNLNCVPVTHSFDEFLTFLLNSGRAQKVKAASDVTVNGTFQDIFPKKAIKNQCFLKRAHFSLYYDGQSPITGHYFGLKWGLSGKYFYLKFDFPLYVYAYSNRTNNEIKTNRNTFSLVSLDVDAEESLFYVASKIPYNFWVFLSFINIFLIFS